MSTDSTKKKDNHVSTSKALDDELNKQICDAAGEFKKEFLQK